MKKDIDEKIAGDLYLELQEIGIIGQDTGEQTAVISFSMECSGFCTIICC